MVCLGNLGHAFAHCGSVRRVLGENVSLLGLERCCRFDILDDRGHLGNSRRFHTVRFKPKEPGIAVRPGFVNSDVDVIQGLVAGRADECLVASSVQAQGLPSLRKGISKAWDSLNGLNAVAHVTGTVQECHTLSSVG